MDTFFFNVKGTDSQHSGELLFKSGFPDSRGFDIIVFPLTCEP